jgi:ferredoxin-thioredoxin reductase catalytic chain
MADELQAEKDKIRAFIAKYCATHQVKVNPDEKVVEMVIEGLARNKVKHGLRYCPCRILSGKPEEDRQKVCPCVWHKLEIEKDGHCHCNLFVKE